MLIPTVLTEVPSVFSLPSYLAYVFLAQTGCFVSHVMTDRVNRALFCYLFSLSICFGFAYFCIRASLMSLLYTKRASKKNLVSNFDVILSFVHHLRWYRMECSLYNTRSSSFTYISDMLDQWTFNDEIKYPTQFINDLTFVK